MPNVLATPRSWKTKSIFAALETTSGTAQAVTGADWVETRNLSITPLESETVDRNVMMDGKGRVAGLLSQTRAKLEFDVALAPSGTAGTKPKWDALMQICGWASTVVASTSVTYNLISKGEKSATFVYYTDGQKQTITGARGSWKLSMDSNGLPMMHFTLIGMYQEPVTDVAGLAAVKTGWMVEEPVGPLRTTGTFNGVAIAYGTYEVDQANDLKYISYAGPQEEVCIYDRAPVFKQTILAPALATLNPFALATNATYVTSVVNHGLTAGKKVGVTVKGRITGINNIDMDGYIGYDIQMGAEASSAGNDEIAVVLT